MNELRSELGDRLVSPSDPRYDEARRLWNGLLDPRPALIAQCRDAQDVLAALGLAMELGLTVSVRGGGHGVAGRASRDDSLVIDLRGMREVTVDPARRIARAEGGATWYDVDQSTAAHGLATTGGLISSTGIGGLTLGGGIGWLVRKYGLTCDNVVGAEIVTADRTLRRVSADQDNELFWALRGGGVGLGVVTAFDYQLHDVDQVIAGIVIHPADRAGAALRFFRDFCAGAPDELTAVFVFTHAPAAPFIPQESHGKAIVVIAVCWSGSIADGERALAPLHAFGPPLVDTVMPMRYVETQQMLDPTAPADQLNYWKSAFLPALTDDILARLVARGIALPSELAQIHVHHLGGAIARPRSGETAFDQRSAAFLVNIPTMWSDHADTEPLIAWTRACHAELANGHQPASYLNFQGRDETLREAWTGPTLDRLREVKRIYDPQSLFGAEP